MIYSIRAEDAKTSYTHPLPRRIPMIMPSVCHFAAATLEVVEQY